MTPPIALSPLPSPPLRALTVFCGSHTGHDPAFLNAARAFGSLLARAGIALVYGGAQRGLMGALADAALAGGGQVVGVIPRQLVAAEVAHQGVSELVIVETMHERKAVMAARADAFVALAGGLGTLEELAEIWTWAQLGLHRKPMGLLDTNGLHGPLLAYLDGLVAAGFVHESHRRLLVVDDDPERLLAALSAPRDFPAPKWTR